MAVPTTSYPLIRIAQVGLIAALIPTIRADAGFQLTATPMADFRAYAEENETSVFREFEITEGTTILIGGSDHLSVIRSTGCEIVIAYPHMWGEYATEQSTSTPDAREGAALMRAMANRDMEQIIKALGIHGSADYLEGQRASVEQEWELELGDDVSFGRITLEVEYELDVS